MVIKTGDKSSYNWKSLSNMAKHFDALMRWFFNLPIYIATLSWKHDFWIYMAVDVQGRMTSSPQMKMQRYD